MLPNAIRRLAPALIVPVLLLGVPLTGCATAAYEVQERLGIEKRDILVNRVEDVSKSQTEAKEEFENALEAFRSVVDFDAGALEDAYDDLSRAHKRAESQAGEVRSRVSSVKRVARDLFREWSGELDQYSDPALRRASERQLADTQVRYDQLVTKMDEATASMEPVLRVFNDRVLYLKHNLNARAIAALDTETATLEADVSRLIAEMERSIAAANAFIQDMNGTA